MNKERSGKSLADYVQGVRNKKGYSLAEVSRRSGGRIGKTHVNRIENGHTTNPSPRMLRALALGLDVLEEEVYAAVRGKALTDPNIVEELLLSKFRELPEATQNDLMKILDILHREHAQPTADVKPTKRGHGRAA